MITKKDVKEEEEDIGILFYYDDKDDDGATRQELREIMQKLIDKLPKEKEMTSEETKDFRENYFG